MKMKIRHLWVLGMSSMIILSACGQNSDEGDQKDHDHKTHKKADKNSNKSEKQSNNTEVDQDSNQETQNNANKEPKMNKQHTQDNQPITIDEAKKIFYNSKNMKAFAQNKDELIYNKDKSNNDEYYVDFAASDARGHPIKSQAIVDRTTGEIKEITYLSSDDPKVDKMLPNEEEKI